MSARPPQPPHACPATGGAHRFEADPAGVPICACGEIEMSPPQALLQIEASAGPFPGEALLPRASRRRIAEGLASLLRARGHDLDVEATLAEQERGWLDAGGVLAPEDRRG